MKEIHVSASREYDVLVGRGLLEQAGAFAAGWESPAGPPSSATTLWTPSTAPPLPHPWNAPVFPRYGLYFPTGSVPRASKPSAKR